MLRACFLPVHGWHAFNPVRRFMRVQVRLVSCKPVCVQRGPPSTLVKLLQYTTTGILKQSTLFPHAHAQQMAALNSAHVQTLPPSGNETGNERKHDYQASSQWPHKHSNPNHCCKYCASVTSSSPWPAGASPEGAARYEHTTNLWCSGAAPERSTKSTDRSKAAREHSTRHQRANGICSHQHCVEVRNRPSGSGRLYVMNNSSPALMSRVALRVRGGATAWRQAEVNTVATSNQGPKQRHNRTRFISALVQERSLG